MIKLYLPMKPLSVNKAWQGKRFKTKECNAYCEECAWRLPKNTSISGLVQIHYWFHLKNWKKTDGDNLVKVLTDCIVNAGIIEDDRMIMRYIIDKIPAKTDGIHVSIDRFVSVDKEQGNDA